MKPCLSELIFYCPQLCSLLFKALFSQTDDDSSASPQVLVRFSDEEEDMVEDIRNPSLWADYI